eukprot:3684909-Amphidinium_carterae.2
MGAITSIDETALLIAIEAKMWANALAGNSIRIASPQVLQYKPLLNVTTSPNLQSHLAHSDKDGILSKRFET